MFDFITAAVLSSAWLIQLVLIYTTYDKPKVLKFYHKRGCYIFSKGYCDESCQERQEEYRIMGKLRYPVISNFINFWKSLGWSLIFPVLFITVLFVPILTITQFLGAVAPISVALVTLRFKQPLLALGSVIHRKLKPPLPEPVDTDKLLKEAEEIMEL